MLSQLMDRKGSQAVIILGTVMILVVGAYVLIESVQTSRLSFEALLIFLLIAPAVFLPAIAFGTHAQEKERADAIIQMQNRHLNVVLENMKQGLCMYDGNGRLIVCNELYWSMYGLKPEMVVPGTYHRDVIMHRIEAGIYDAKSADQFISRREDWVRKPTFGKKVETLGDGRVFCVTVQPLPNGGWVSTHEDITERKKAEQEIIRHRDHLQEMVEAATRDIKMKAQELEIALAKEKELNELQRKFIAMASHEFRTPLAIIDSSARRLEKSGTATPETLLKRTTKIRSAVSRMTRLMESSLTAARLESGKIAIKPCECRIRALLAEVCERQQELSETHRISCDVGDIPEVIRADCNALDQIFTNLLSNAVKYAPDAPDIRVRARRDGACIAVSVQDFGIGMDKGDVPRIGERFFRAKTSVGIAGTGIGLNLVGTLVRLHEGSFKVESEKGQGSIFTVRLPIEGPREEARARESASLTDAA